MESLFQTELVILDTIKSEATLLYVVRMRAGENSFTIAMDNDLNSCLDCILEDVTRQPPTLKVALILTGTGKFFSTGLDLSSYLESKSPQELFHTTYVRFITRLLAFPMITVAAINGHAIAGGMVAAVTCDYRIMNSERGFMAMNEIHLPSSVPAALMVSIQSRVANPALVRDIFLLGRRYTGREMHEAGLIDALGDDPEVVFEMAKNLATSNAHPIQKMPFIELIKTLQHRETLKVLKEREVIDHFTFGAKMNKM